MKIDRIEILIAEGVFCRTDEFRDIEQTIVQRIEGMKWHSQDEFIINPTKKGNGVKPICKLFCDNLPKGWKGQDKFSVVKGEKKPGPIDGVVETMSGRFALEWETGNISSSHRALNKLSLGIIEGSLIGGFLILPTKKFYNYLTDRVGNFEELAPYFPLYKNLSVPEGFLGVIAVEHDGVSNDAPLFPKGKDGNALKGT